MAGALRPGKKPSRVSLGEDSNADYFGPSSLGLVSSRRPSNSDFSAAEENKLDFGIGCLEKPAVSTALLEHSAGNRAFYKGIADGVVFWFYILSLDEARKLWLWSLKGEGGAPRNDMVFRLPPGGYYSGLPAELHIEQGPCFEKRGIPLGGRTAIAAARQSQGDKDFRYVCFVEGTEGRGIAGGAFILLQVRKSTPFWPRQKINLTALSEAAPGRPANRLRPVDTSVLPRSEGLRLGGKCSPAPQVNQHYDGVGRIEVDVRDIDQDRLRFSHSTRTSAAWRNKPARADNVARAGRRGRECRKSGRPKPD